MDKVIVTQEVATAIKYFREQGRTNTEIFREVLHPHAETEPGAPHIRALRTIDEDELMQALVLDYEVKKTLEQEIVELVLYHEGQRDHENNMVLEGIRCTLEVVSRHDKQYEHLSEWAEHDFSGAPFKAGDTE